MGVWEILIHSAGVQINFYKVLNLMKGVVGHRTGGAVNVEQGVVLNRLAWARAYRA